MIEQIYSPPFDIFDLNRFLNIRPYAVDVVEEDWDFDIDDLTRLFGMRPYDVAPDDYWDAI